LLAALGACAGERPTLGAAHAGTAPRSSTSTSTTAAASSSSTTAPDRTIGPDDLLGFIATPKGAPQVFTTADLQSAPISVPARTDAGAPTTFAVIGDPTQPDPTAGGWVQVLLPTRPNGSLGWVPPDSTTITKTPYRVYVELGPRRIRIEKDGVEVFSAPIAIGTAQNPTPTGGTYVTELIENVNPKGSYGPFAFGLALHSDTLTEFAGGDGQVGIHGTNAPQLIGQAVSHGCVRLEDGNIRRVVDLALPLGVPVFIT
jgi:lipoprotein-anchoring transpeptidase ErfK/SrfK